MIWLCTLAEGQIVAENALYAEARLGELLGDVEHRGGSSTEGTSHPLPPGIDKKASHYAQQLAKNPDTIAEVVEAAKEHGELPTRRDVLRAIRSDDVEEKVDEVRSRELPPVDGLFDVIVVDPPWPSKKIEREVRPNQVGLDYPTMSIERISLMKVPCAADSHVWLWTTHKYLPLAFQVLETWKLKYGMTFVWHKPGGYQPFGLPQYNCEFALYARLGTPNFIDLKGLSACFTAPRGGHSEKPLEFYDVVRRITSGRRLDMFARRGIEGFTGWGNELREG